MAKYKLARSKITLLHRLFEEIHKFIYRKADWIIAIDKLCREQAEKGGAGHKTSLIMNAVNTSVFYPDGLTAHRYREQTGFPKESKIIFFAGRLEEVKNIENLIKAVAILRLKKKQIHLLVAGEGTLKPVLEKVVSANGLESCVQFLGKVDHNVLPDYYRVANVFALPSKMEGVPMVVLEALACGTPVVATTVGGIPDIVKNGSNGYLLKDGSSNEIAKGLDKALLTRFDRIEVAKSVDQWSARNVARKLEAIFSRVALAGSSL
jgi:glycosyltransferase involved in cell wall biosynthesis